MIGHIKDTLTMKIAIILDPIESIDIKKDTSFAIMLEAQSRNWEIYYLQIADIIQKLDGVYAHAQRIQVYEKKDLHFTTEQKTEYKLTDFNVVLMRKDPPIDMSYMFCNQLLCQAEREGVWIINSPQSLLSFNEKLSILKFPQHCVSTIVSSVYKTLRDFLEQEEEVVIKPLDNMGGNFISHVSKNSNNIKKKILTMTCQESVPIMMQKFIPEYIQGDKRIIMIDGYPFKHALLRIPAPGKLCANLVAGGTPKGASLNEKETQICNDIGVLLKQNGIVFAGVDIISGYLTEINITSPTCVREIDKIFNVNVSSLLCDVIESRLND